MAKRFYDGQKLQSVTGPYNDIEQTCTFYMVGHNDCTSITVVCECPHPHCTVPFAVIDHGEKPACRVNLLLMEDVVEAEPCTP